jgi:hypothetical protein
MVRRGASAHIHPDKNSSTDRLLAFAGDSRKLADLATGADLANSLAVDDLVQDRGSMDEERPQRFRAGESR